MINNFDALLSAVNAALNRSQLESSYDVADTFLDTWLNASAITPIEYHIKKAVLDDAYHRQLIKEPKLIKDAGGLSNVKKWLPDLFHGVHYIYVNGEIRTTQKPTSRSFTKRALEKAIESMGVKL